jgi:hypothetical protein
MTKMVYGLAAFGVTVALIGAGTVLTRPSPATPAVEASWVSSSGSIALPATVAPEATRALNQMGEYLRTLKAFQVKAVISRESVMLDGQKVQFDGTADLLVQRPNRLRMETKSDRSERRFFYDGKSFTLFAPRTTYYATVAAPPTIGQLADTLEARFAIQLPLVDLFRWGTPEGVDGNLTSANYIGPSQIEGVTCEQYAFRQDGVDWQVWVQSGEFKLPRKVVITTTTDEARPQYSAVYTWNLAPSFDDQAFAFVPDKDSHRIVLADAMAANKSRKK